MTIKLTEKILASINDNNIKNLLKKPDNGGIPAIANMTKQKLDAKR